MKRRKIPKKIYLAVPYSHEDDIVKQKRADLVTDLAAKLMNEGHIVFSPITHGHAIAISNDLPTDWDYWSQTCISFIADWCDEVYVYAIDGWTKSKGVLAEIDVAYAHNRKITFIEE